MKAPYHYKNPKIDDFVFFDVYPFFDMGMYSPIIIENRNDDVQKYTKYFIIPPNKEEIFVVAIDKKSFEFFSKNEAKYDDLWLRSLRKASIVPLKPNYDKFDLEPIYCQHNTYEFYMYKKVYKKIKSLKVKKLQ